jgi:hypothetical protein
MFPLIGPEMIEAWACRPNECDESAQQIEASPRRGETAAVSYRRSLSSLSINLRWITRNRLIVGKRDNAVFRRFRKWVGA